MDTFSTLSDRLYDHFTLMKSPKEIWNALEVKYKTDKIGMNKFIIQKYFDYKMIDNMSFLDQVHNDGIEAQRKKWEEDKIICRGHILNTFGLTL